MYVLYKNRVWKHSLGICCIDRRVVRNIMGLINICMQITTCCRRNSLIYNKVACMAVASGPAGLVLAGPVFTVLLELCMHR